MLPSLVRSSRRPLTRSMLSIPSPVRSMTLLLAGTEATIRASRVRVVTTPNAYFFADGCRASIEIWRPFWSATTSMAWTSSRSRPRFSTST